MTTMKRRMALNRKMKKEEEYYNKTTMKRRKTTMMMMKRMKKSKNIMVWCCSTFVSLGGGKENLVQWHVGLLVITCAESKAMQLCWMDEDAPMLWHNQQTNNQLAQPTINLSNSFLFYFLLFSAANRIPPMVKIFFPDKGWPYIATQMRVRPCSNALFLFWSDPLCPKFCFQWNKTKINFNYDT